MGLDNGTRLGGAIVGPFLRWGSKDGRNGSYGMAGSGYDSES